MFPVYNPSIPSVTAIHEKLQPGVHIDIHGEVVKKGHHKDFAVELLSGPHIVLHINFRFHKEHNVCMNSYGHNHWGTEVKHKNPLHHGDNFHLHIEVHHSHYTISVNGTHLANFEHRFPAASVQGLGLKGDVAVREIQFHGFPMFRNWNTTYDWGHTGYYGYGNDGYVAPQFFGGHHTVTYWT